MPASDLHTYLSSLLVTDRQGLVFLYQTVLGEGEATMEEMVGALARHVASSGRSAPAGLRHWLDNPMSLSPKLLARVIRLSGFYRDEEVVDPLRGVLSNKALAAVHPAAVRSVALVLGVQAATELSQMLWATPVAQWHVRETAILEELGVLGWASSVDDLIRALGVPYDTPVRAAAGALARYDVDEVLPRLTDLMDSSDSVRQQAGAAQALGLLGDARAVPTLQRILPRQGLSPIVGCAAALALARLGDSSAERPLHQLGRQDNGHEGAELRAASMMGVGLLVQGGHEIGADSRALLLKGLEDSQPEVRSAAAKALALAADLQAADDLCQALHTESSPLVQIDMVHALGELANPSSIGALVQVLRERGVAQLKVEALMALASFGDPSLAQYITPFRGDREEEIAKAADRALRRLLYRSFSWPDSAHIAAPVRLELHSLDNARTLLLPPPVVEEPGFFDRIFGSGPPSVPKPEPIGWVGLDPEGVEVVLGGQELGRVEWADAFSVQMTREPIGSRSDEDIGVHFVVRQRQRGSAAEFQRVAFSLWCAPSDRVGTLEPKSEELPCLNPHQSGVMLSALRYYAEVHGERLPML